jgi:hypothetical protein
VLVEPGRGLVVLLGVLAGEAALGPDRLGVVDGEGHRAEDVEEGLVPVGHHDLDGERVDHLHGRHVLGDLAGLILDGDEALEGELDVLGGHRVAAGELHAFPELELPGLAAVHQLPALGQERLDVDVVSRGHGHQRLVGCAHREGRRVLELAGRV